MGAHLCLMGTIKIYLQRSSNALHLLRSPYLHHRQACLRGHHRLRLVTVARKGFCLQVSIPLRSKAFPHRHLQVWDLHLDLDHLLAKAPHPEWPLDFNSQALEGLDSVERSKEHCSRRRMRNRIAREEE